jgi:hypothetical protein
MVAKVRPQTYDESSSALAELRDALSTGDDYRLVALLKKFVPEFISNNSRFTHLDKEKTTRTEPHPSFAPSPKDKPSSAINLD